LPGHSLIHQQASLSMPTFDQIQITTQQSPVNSGMQPTQALIFVAGIAAFAIPEGQTDGIYYVAHYCAGSEEQTPMAHTTGFPVQRPIGNLSLAPCSLGGSREDHRCLYDIARVTNHRPPRLFQRAHTSWLLAPQPNCPATATFRLRRRVKHLTDMPLLLKSIDNVVPYSGDGNNPPTIR
jgi:hypothetical protein